MLSLPLIILGLLFGIILILLFNKFVNFANERGKIEASRQYFNGNSFENLFLTIRAVYFRYKEHNKNFLIDIKINEKSIITLTHRRNYSDLKQDERDDRFGMAMIMTFPCNQAGKQKLEHAKTILDEFEREYYYDDIQEVFILTDLSSDFIYNNIILMDNLIEYLFNYKNGDNLFYEVLDGKTSPVHYKIY